MATMSNMLMIFNLCGLAMTKILNQYPTADFILLVPTVKVENVLETYTVVIVFIYHIT